MEINETQLLKEIRWLKTRQVSSVRQYNEYLRQIRHKELSIAFAIGYSNRVWSKVAKRYLTKTEHILYGEI